MTLGKLETHLLVGDNPFNGVNHFSQEHSRRRRSLSEEEMIRVISVAHDNGATGFAFSSTPRVLGLLKRMKECNFSNDLNLFPVIPDIQSYFQLIAERGMAGALIDRLRKMGTTSATTSMFGGGVGLATGSPKRILKTYVKGEVSLIEGLLPSRAKIKSVFLHEIATDLMVSLGMTNLFDSYCQIAADNLGVIPGFVTRNFARFVNFTSLTSSLMKDIFVMTPFNKVGFQMNPSQEDCEQSLINHPNLNVIAMSVLAGGCSGVVESAKYLMQLKEDISCVVGVSTEEHAAETFSTFKSLLHRG